MDIILKNEEILDITANIKNDFLKGDRGPQGENGKNGTNGANGVDGYTPQKGIDYWNETDIAELEKHCEEYIDAHITQVIGGAY